MTNAELVKKMAIFMNEHSAAKTQGALSEPAISAVLYALTEISTAELKDGGEISLLGLGKLKVKPTPARKGRHPRTGQEINIPAGRRIVFSSCGALRQAMGK